MPALGGFGSDGPRGASTAGAGRSLAPAPARLRRRSLVERLLDGRGRNFIFIGDSFDVRRRLVLRSFGLGMTSGEALPEAIRRIAFRLASSRAAAVQQMPLPTSRSRPARAPPDVTSDGVHRRRDRSLRGGSANSSNSANSAGASSDRRRRSYSGVGCFGDGGRFGAFVAATSVPAARLRPMRVSAGVAPGTISATRPTSAPRADALQHHVADADRRLDAPCFSASCAPRRGRPRRDCESRAAGRAASLAPTNMPSRANAAIGGSMPSTRRCSRSTSGIARPAGCRRPRSGCRGCRRRNRAARSRRSRACRARRQSRAAAPAGPRRSASSRPASLRDLPPVRFGRAENLARRARRRCRAEHAGADRIGPQDPRAVGRPQPGGQAARRMHRQPRIADACNWNSALFIANDMTAWLSA